MLKWIIERLEGRAAAVETPVGSVPAPGSLDVDGLNLPPEALEAVLTVDAEEWQAELALIEDWFAMLGPRLPAVLRTELDGLADHVGSELPASVHGPMTSGGSAISPNPWSFRVDVAEQS